VPDGHFQRKWTKTLPKFVRVLFHPVVESLHLLGIEEAQDALLQLARSFSGDDLHQGGLLPDRLIHDVAQCLVDVRTTVVDVVQVELEFHGIRPVRV